MDIDAAGDDDNLWAKELAFAERGLEAVQNLRRVKNEAQSAPPPKPQAPQAPPTVVQPTTPFESNDLLGPDDSDDDDPDADDDDLARDVDGNLAPIEDTDDFMELNMMHDQELPPIPQDDYAREIEIEDIRQQHIMANQRRREANYLDNVKSLNITSLRIHASEFGRTRVQEGEQCELLKRGDNGNVTGNVVKIPLVGSLEFLDSEEERAMFHELDGKPWTDRNPAWKTERLESLQKWLKAAEALVNGKDRNAKKVVLNMNEFVGWTYLYRFMKEEAVATALQGLGNLLLPNNAANDADTEDYANLNWIREREKFLDGLIQLLPTHEQMQSLEASANIAESGDGDFDRYGNPEILSFTWSYLFFLLIYRQVIVHEFFIFCTYKHKVAPQLEAVSTQIQFKVNKEESQDDIMHQKWQELLNKFALFRDILTGRQDRFTHHLQRYLTLSHERIKISHERNMVRSEKVVFATVYDWMSKNNKTDDIATLDDAKLTTEKLFATEFFDNAPTLPSPPESTGTESAPPTGLINRFFTGIFGTGT